MNSKEWQAIRSTGKPSRPGRRQPPIGIPEKPGELDTIYRSRLFVSEYHSADGNGYKPGEPIPLAEAIRQGQVAVEEGVVVRMELPEPETIIAEIERPITNSRAVPRDMVLRARTVCPRCGGTGKRLATKNHRPDCKCPRCMPCIRCGGVGKILLEEVRPEELPAESIL